MFRHHQPTVTGVDGPQTPTRTQACPLISIRRSRSDRLTRHADARLGSGGSLGVPVGCSVTLGCGVQSRPFCTPRWSAGHGRDDRSSGSVEGALWKSFQFDRGEKITQMYGSEGLRATRIAEGDGQVHLTCLSVEPGGVIGTHPAADTQLSLIMAGEGWVAGPDDEQVPIITGWGVRWDAGESHSSGTATGLTALAIEGAALGLLEPEVPEP